MHSNCFSGYEIRAPIHLPACKSRSGHYSATAQLALSTTWIFPRITDTTRQLSYPRETFTRICRDARIQNLRMHDLRRTFATRVLQATSDIAMASRLLNHHSLTATRRYAFHNAADTQAVVSQVVDTFK
jgi:integrase